MRKWNRLSGCLGLGLNGNETKCNSEPAEAMTCQHSYSLLWSPPISFPVSSLTRDVSSSQRPLRHSVDTCNLQEEEKLWVCSSVWFLPLFIFTLSSPVGYVLLVDLLQIYHTLSSTQQTQLISSRSITESSLEDTSRNPPFVAAELLGDAWGKYVGMLDKSDCTICV